MLSSHIAGGRFPGGMEAHLQRCAGPSLQGFPVESDAVPSQAVMQCSQDALHSATVELSEDF